MFCNCSERKGEWVNIVSLFLFPISESNSFRRCKLSGSLLFLCQFSLVQRQMSNYIQSHANQFKHYSSCSIAQIGLHDSVCQSPQIHISRAHVSLSLVNSSSARAWFWRSPHCIYIKYIFFSHCQTKILRLILRINRKLQRDDFRKRCQ